VNKAMFVMAWVTPNSVTKLELSFNKQVYEFKDCFRAIDDQLSKMQTVVEIPTFPFTSVGQNSNLYLNVVYFFNTRVDYTSVAA
jgi:hypothetical protein